MRLSRWVFAIAGGAARRAARDQHALRLSPRRAVLHRRRIASGVRLSRPAAAGAAPLLGDARARARLAARLAAALGARGRRDDAARGAGRARGRRRTPGAGDRGGVHGVVGFRARGRPLRHDDDLRPAEHDGARLAARAGASSAAAARRCSRPASSSGSAVEAKPQVGLVAAVVVAALLVVGPRAAAAVVVDGGRRRRGGRAGRART